MRKVHPEFAYQARELEGQIEGILRDPPDHKNYKKMVEALRTEYVNGTLDTQSWFPTDAWYYGDRNNLSFSPGPGADRKSVV